MILLETNPTMNGIAITVFVLIIGWLFYKVGKRKKKDE